MNFSDYSSFGEWLSVMMTLNHITQEQLAKRIGVSRMTINRWLNDITVPDYYGICALLEVFKLKITLIR